MTRLKSLCVRDFRSIDGEVNVSLDAPIVLIHGPNGAGKTSLLSAIELALTGAVPSLSRADPDYLAYLPHKGRPFGEVRLEVAEADGLVRKAEIRITTSEITGTPILAGPDAGFFSERSYLAQSTLGRLLEIYQYAEKKSDSPLTRFVKELLGLDRMEALIGGLYTAGNIARLKGPVPSYAQIRDSIPAREREIEVFLQKEVDAATLINTLEGQLRERLAMIDPSLLDAMGDLNDLARRLAVDAEDSELTDLIRAKREVEVSQESWTSIANSPGAAGRTSIEANRQAASAALQTWTGQHGERIEALLGRAAAFFADVSVSSESHYVERAQVLGERIEADLDRVQRVLAAHESALHRRDDLARQLGEARARLVRIDEEIAASAATNESAARALSNLNAHIHDEICPVCDRDFSEVSRTPLSAHVAAKIAAVVEQAGRLQALTQGRSQNNAEVVRFDREWQAANSTLLAEAELSALKTRAANLTEIARQLIDTLSQMQEGDQLRSESARAAQTFLTLQNADQSAIVLRSGLDDLARRLRVRNAAGDDIPTVQLLQSIRSAIEQREAALTQRQSIRRSVGETVTSLAAARDNRASLQAQQRAAEGELTQLKAQKAEADKVIDLAKDLARQTREARGRVVRRVFNDQLNMVWRDLFVRLAPEEPFIPAFAIPDSAGADIEAVLETHHRRGGKGGNPRAMLSAGNLNTAALTLFLALHLSVPARLPLLVVDDPVQSMDEVHISQFAALLRTLSKQMQRQVVIAVHERSLFDYLTLELSPAFEGDRLNIIELGRNSIGQTTSRWDPRLYVADRAVA